MNKLVKNKDKKHFQLRLQMSVPNVVSLGSKFFHVAGELGGIVVEATGQLTARVTAPHLGNKV